MLLPLAVSAAPAAAGPGPGTISLAATKGAWEVEVDTVIRGDWVQHSENPNLASPKSPLDDGQGGNSTGRFELAYGVDKTTRTAVRFAYSLGGNYEYRYAMLNYGYNEPRDLSPYRTLRFWLKGSGNKLRVQFCTLAVTDYDFHGYDISETPKEWKLYEVPFAALKQGGWGRRAGFSAAGVEKIQFKAASMIEDEKGYFALDRVEFTTSSVFADRISGDTFVYSDFEGTLMDRLANPWIADNDSPNQGNSTCNVSQGQGQGGSLGSLRLDYDLGQAYKYRYAIARVQYEEPIDISMYNVIRFWLRGSGHKVKFHICMNTVKDYDWHGRVIDATTPEWKQYEVELSGLKQEGWGIPKPVDLRNVARIEFQTGSAAPGEQGWFEVDSITFSKK